MIWSELRGALRGKGLIRADEAAGDGLVTGIAYDSRRVERGNVFVALQGLHADGAAFARDAIERGAMVVVSERPAPPDAPVAWVLVEDARLALAVLAAAFWGHPSGD